VEYLDIFKGAFKTICKRILSIVMSACSSVFVSTENNSAVIGWVSMKFDFSSIPRYFERIQQLLESDINNR